MHSRVHGWQLLSWRIVVPDSLSCGQVQRLRGGHSVHRLRCWLVRLLDRPVVAPVHGAVPSWEVRQLAWADLQPVQWVVPVGEVRVHPRAQFVVLYGSLCTGLLLPLWQHQCHCQPVCRRHVQPQWREQLLVVPGRRLRCRRRLDVGKLLGAVRSGLCVQQWQHQSYWDALHCWHIRPRWVRVVHLLPQGHLRHFKPRVVPKLH